MSLMTSRFSWHAVESARGGATFEVARDGVTIVEVCFRVRDVDDSAALNAMCAALAGDAGSGEETGRNRRTTAQRNGADPEPVADTPSTLEQQRSIHIEMQKLGGQYRDRAFRLKVISTVFGRPVSSTKDLTYGEAERVLVRTLELLARRGAA